MEKKIKIAAITTISKTMDWFVIDSMKNLYQHGFDITLICDMEREFFEKNSDYAKCYSIRMKRGIDPFGAIYSILYMYKIFKKEKFDVIQYMSPNASLYAAIAGKMANIEHRIYNQCGLRYVNFQGIKRKIFKQLEILTCKLSTAVKAQSPQNMQFAIREKLCPEKKISVIGIGGTVGVDLKEYDIEKKQIYKQEIQKKYNLNNEILFGYVGRINADKGINELIQAFRSLCKKEKEIKLMLVGMYDETNPIRMDLMEWAKNSSKVILTGNVSKNEVCKYMATFDILVHPTYREGFGKVLQEAMAMETPIITTNVPGPSEVIENDISGILVEARNWKELEIEMGKLMHDNRRRERYSYNGRKRAEKYFDRTIMLKNIWIDYAKELNLSID